MCKEKRKVPKLRFPGFTEDWEQRKLGDLYKRVNERNDGSLGRDKWISVAKMYFQDPDKVQSNNLDTRTYVMKKGDIAFEGHPNNEFKFGRFVLNDIGTGIISELFPIYRPITEYDLDFWKYAIQLERVMAPIFAKSITSSGNSSNKLDHNHFLNQELLVPNIEEQKKIGTLLSILSKNITLHQRKLEHLNLKKKALLQKLFPKNGECYPELCFPGFTDAWEQRKLSEVTAYFDNLRVPVTASDRVPGKIPYYGANGIQDYVSGHTHSGEFVLIAEDGANDLNDYPIQYVNGAIWVNNHAHVIAGYKEKLENKFLSYSLKTVKMSTFIVGGGRSKLNLKALLEIPISMPNHDEQCCIGEFIETIDKTITLHQRKLDHLQLQKKALLQQMFV